MTITGNSSSCTAHVGTKYLCLQPSYLARVSDRVLTHLLLQFRQYPRFPTDFSFSNLSSEFGDHFPFHQQSAQSNSIRTVFPTIFGSIPDLLDPNYPFRLFWQNHQALLCHSHAATNKQERFPISLLGQTQNKVPLRREKKKKYCTRLIHA